MCFWYGSPEPSTMRNSRIDIISRFCPVVMAESRDRICAASGSPNVSESKR